MLFLAEPEPARNCELNVHQADNFQRARQLESVVAHAFEQRLRNVDCRQHARRIAGVNSGLFDVLHDSADHHVFAIRERVHVNLNCVFQKMIDQHRSVVRVLDSLFHVANDRLFVVGNHHGAAAEHVRRPHQHGKSDAARAFDGLVDRGGHHAGSLRDLQLFEQLVEVLAIFGQVNRFGRGADNFYARFLQRQARG